MGAGTQKGTLVLFFELVKEIGACRGVFELLQKYLEGFNKPLSHYGVDPRYGVYTFATLPRRDMLVSAWS